MKATMIPNIQAIALVFVTSSLLLSAEPSAVAFNHGQWVAATPTQRSATVAGIIDGLQAGRLTYAQDMGWSPAFSDFMKTWEASDPLPLADKSEARLKDLAALAVPERAWPSQEPTNVVQVWDELWRRLSRDYVATLRGLTPTAADDLLLSQFEGTTKVHLHWGTLEALAEAIGPGHEARVRGLYWPLQGAAKWGRHPQAAMLMFQIWQHQTYAPAEEAVLAMLLLDPITSAAAGNLQSLGVNRRNEIDADEDDFPMQTRQFVALQADPARSGEAAEMGGDMLNLLAGPTSVSRAEAYVTWLETAERERPDAYHQQRLLSRGVSAWLTNINVGEPPRNLGALAGVFPRLRTLLARSEVWQMAQLEPAKFPALAPVTIAELRTRLDALLAKSGSD